MICTDTMLEIAHNFEQSAATFAPALLAGPGLACVITGLFLWLGGLGFRKIFIALTAAGYGGFAGFLISGRNSLIIIGSAVIAAIVALVMQKVFETDSVIWKVISALCCAAMGTLFVFTGMILLLLYKGSLPVSTIGNKQSFYAGVFAAMIAFGAIIQLLLCGSPGGKQREKEQTENEK